MRLVPPKGKVEAISIAVFSTPCGYPYSFPDFYSCGTCHGMFHYRNKMEVTVNHQHYQLSTDCSVSEMLSIVLQSEAKNIAVAVNQSIVAKSDWPAHLLNQGDQVILIKATQGG